MFSGETPETAREDARSPARVTRRILSSEVRTQLREIIWVSARERALREVWIAAACSPPNIAPMNCAFSATLMPSSATAEAWLQRMV